MSILKNLFTSFFCNKKKSNSCHLRYIPIHLHQNDKPIIKEFAKGEILYYRCKPHKLEFPYNDISLRDISHNRNFGEDAIFREDDVMYNVLPENKFEKYNDCNLIKLEINDLTNNITYHKKIIKTHEDGYQAIVEITLEHKPIPCMYPHSAFVIVLNDVIVDEKNYDETINQKKGAYKKLFSNIRREIREELTSLMISKKINDTINTEVINEL